MATFLFTLEVTGKCPEPEAEHWLRIAVHALAQVGFAIDDAQAIGIDGAKGVAIDFPDAIPPTLAIASDGAVNDTRRMSDVPGRMR